MNFFFQILLYSPRVYSGLDHLMVEVTKQAAVNGYTNVCIYSDTMEHMPQLQRDIDARRTVCKNANDSVREGGCDDWFKKKLVDEGL